MAAQYQYNSDGFFIGMTDDFGGPLPHNADLLPPPETLADGSPIPPWHRFRRTGPGQFELVEDHRGREGLYTAEGLPFTPDAWGPLPAGTLTEPPLPSLEDARAQARAALKARRQQFEYSGFTLNGQRWDSEQKDELRLNSAYRIFEAGLSEYPGWKIADGVYLTLTPELLAAATQALMLHYGKAFELEQAKAAELENLADAEAVLAWMNGPMLEGWE